MNAERPDNSDSPDSPDSPGSLDHDAPTEGDGPAVEAGLRAGFGPILAMVDARVAMSVLAELEDRLGSDTRVHLRNEGDEQSAASSPSVTSESRYQMLGEIARGGMGIIIRSHDNDLGRDVAMKVLRPRHADNAAMVRRFVEEAQIAGQLQHPGILQVYELGLQPDKRPYFTMKLIKGRTLAEHLEDRLAPDEERRRYLSIFERVCQTMAYAHARGVMHRDLKPANIMVGNFGEVQIVDWGLAKLIRAEGEAPDRDEEGGHETVIHLPGSDVSASQSVMGSVMGTPAYMPPEQARGEVDLLDERVDVFALGAILCEILTGKPPYTGDTRTILEDAKDGHLAGAHAGLGDCGADDELVEVARACLVPRRADRLRDAKAVAEAVTGYLASLEERARASELAAVEARAKAVEERRARRLTIALGATVLAAIVVGSGGMQWKQHQDLQRIVAGSRELNEQLNAAIALLEAAKETPVSDQKPWMALRAAGAHVATMSSAVELDQETRERASAFLDELDTADRDRRMIERIEDLVIVGTTHDDPESWMAMEVQLRDAFADYGIDLTAMTRPEVADRIRSSAVAPQLADALELWIGTCGFLSFNGVPGYSKQQMIQWSEVLYDADPDPYRTSVRRQVYADEPDLETLTPLAHSPQFDTAMARTLAWLASCFLRAGDMPAMEDVFRRALILYPTDFMLNFDYALNLEMAGQLEESIRYYHRALALRPTNSGMWRRLGVALRKAGDLDASIDAMNQSVSYQDDYAPTYVDLGLCCADAGRTAEAIEAYRKAIAMNPDLPLAHCHLGRALQNEGMLLDALAELQRGHELGSRDATWQLPSEDWIAECRRLLQDSGRENRPSPEPGNRDG